MELCSVQALHGVRVLAPSGKVVCVLTPRMRFAVHGNTRYRQSPFRGPQLVTMDSCCVRWCCLRSRSEIFSALAHWFKLLKSVIRASSVKRAR